MQYHYETGNLQQVEICRATLSHLLPASKRLPSVVELALTQSRGNFTSLSPMVCFSF